MLLITTGRFTTLLYGIPVSVHTVLQISNLLACVTRTCTLFEGVVVTVKPNYTFKY